MLIWSPVDGDEGERVGCGVAGAQAAPRRSSLAARGRDQVAHATAWYLREETLTPAIDEVVNYHHRLPATRAWGDGTFASSDGQRFPGQVKAANAGALPRYFGFGRGLSVLTSVTDHYATFGTKVIPTRVWEAVHLIEGLLANESDIQPTTVHADTQGQSAPVFVLATLFGFDLMPRIRNFRDLTFFRANGHLMYRHIDALFGERTPAGAAGT